MKIAPYSQDGCSYCVDVTIAGLDRDTLRAKYTSDFSELGSDQGTYSTFSIKWEFDKMGISRNFDRQNTELGAKTSKLVITSAILAENPCKK